MANPKGNPENLTPVLTTEEAKKRGAAGGRKSGETRRKKRDARQSIGLLMNMAAQGTLDENLEKLGFDECDRTNMNALMARMFAKAISGDVSAFRALMDYGGFHPDQKLKDKERKAHIVAMEASKKETDISDFSAVFEENDAEDVQIYMPDNGRNDAR